MTLALVRRHVARSQTRRAPGRRLNSSQAGGAEGKQRSAHGQWYADMLPGMVPVALLGSAVYMVRFCSASEVRVHALIAAVPA